MATKHKLKFSIKGKGIDPSRIPASELADFLKKFEQVVGAVHKKRKKVDAVGLVISLTGIHKGSAIYAFDHPTEYNPDVRAVIEAIHSGDFAGIPAEAQQTLHEVYNYTKGTARVIRLESGTTEKIATIDEDSPIEAPVIYRISGITTVHGDCVGIGGVEPKVDIRLYGSRKIIHATCERALVEKIASRVYKDISVTGEATWDPSNYQIQSFHVHKLNEAFAPKKPSLAFKECADNLGEALDKLDAKKLLKELRD